MCFMLRVSYQLKKHHVADHSATTDGIEIVLLAVICIMFEALNPAAAGVKHTYCDEFKNG